MKKRYINFSIILIACLCIFSSCRSLQSLAYFQKGTTANLDTISTAKPYNSTIQPGDLLSVYVGSLSDEASKFFNPYPDASAGSGAAAALSSSEANGFLVDQSGEIALPIVGSFKIAGLTTLEAKNLLLKKLGSYLKEPRVIVRVINYKISMMGEVNKPSVYVIPNEKITITEAISLAGDLSNYARRDNIMIIRDNNGKKEFGTINLNDRSVFNSPYYYLRANDIVYVEPVGAKSLQTNTFVRLIPIVLSITSFLIIIFTRLL